LRLGWLGLEPLTDADYFHPDGTPVMSKSQASDVIGHLLEQKKNAPKSAPKTDNTLPDVPAGRYALVAEKDGEPTTYFFRVDRPTEGRWKGYTFVKVQAGDDLWPLKDAAKRRNVLAQIAADPQDASIRYGREIGSCGVCGRTLTDEQSRADGIGPICKGKMGW
jgi:hypothetical protein